MNRPTPPGIRRRTPPGQHVKWAMERGMKCRPGEFYMPDGSLWWIRPGGWECYWSNEDD